MSLPHLGLVLMINLFWGFNFVASKWVLVDLPPFWGVFFRFVLVLLICLPWLKPRRDSLRSLIIIGLLGAAHFSAIFLALDVSKSAGTMAIASQLGVPFSTIMAVVFLNERIGWKRISGILLAFAGIVLIKFEPGGGGENTWALIFIISATVIFATISIMMRRIRGVQPLELQAWTGLVSIVPLGLMAFIREGNPMPYVEAAGWLSWSGVIYGAIFSSVIAHAANFYLLQRYPVTTVAPFTLLAPLIGVVSGILVLGDPITAGLILGGLLTMSGVGVITLRSITRAKRLQ